MTRPISVDEWVEVEAEQQPDGSWQTMMGRVAQFHHKHDFASPENNGHDMGYRLALVIEELGELSAAITKGKPKEEEEDAEEDEEEDEAEAPTSMHDHMRAFIALKQKAGLSFMVARQRWMVSSNR